MTDDRDARLEALAGLRTDSLRALVLYLTQDETVAALAELVDSDRWHDALSRR